MESRHSMLTTNETVKRPIPAMPPSARRYSKLPSHGGQPLDWKNKPNLQLANHGGANIGFDYMFPVSKYVEAYALGPTYVSYLSYQIGNQPYAYYDYTGLQTPRVPNWLALQKVSPKSSAAGIQQAQVQLGRMLANRSVPYMGG